MAGAGAYRSRVRIWRPTETRGARGATATAWAAVGTAWCSIAVPRRGLTNYGAGELPEGSLELETQAQVALQARDLLEVIAGPEAGTWWRAESAHRPDGRRLLANVAVHNGERPQP